VQVFLVLDAWGSRGLDDDFIESLKEGGINFRWFGKLVTKHGLHINAAERKTFEDWFGNIMAAAD